MMCQLRTMGRRRNLGPRLRWAASARKRRQRVADNKKKTLPVITTQSKSRDSKPCRAQIQVGASMNRTLNL